MSEALPLEAMTDAPLPLDTQGAHDLVPHDLVPHDVAALGRRVEAVLFASDEPLGAEKIATLVDATADHVRDAVAWLSAQYGEAGRSFGLRLVAGGYQLCTLPAYAHLVQRLYKGRAAALSQAALEVLAIIAYRQPLTRIDIERIRGTSSETSLRHLLERGLIRISGRAELPGRPLEYATTVDFLKAFGLSELNELPSLREIAELYGDDAANLLAPSEPIVQDEFVALEVAEAELVLAPDEVTIVLPEDIVVVAPEAVILVASDAIVVVAPEASADAPPDSTDSTDEPLA